jgi:hypothetical protein
MMYSLSTAPSYYGGGGLGAAFGLALAGGEAAEPLAPGLAALAGAAASPDAAATELAGSAGGTMSFWPIWILLGSLRLFALAMASTVLLLPTAMAEMVSPSFTV